MCIAIIVFLYNITQNDYNSQIECVYIHLVSLFPSLTAHPAPTPSLIYFGVVTSKEEGHERGWICSAFDTSGSEKATFLQVSLQDCC